MKVNNVVSELQHEMGESQNSRDARIEALWRKLDYQHKGELDWKALQGGLRRIDHPMKNADDMLKKTIRVVDTDGDGKIQYEEFRTFVEAAEKQLWLLFRSIDKDNNGKLDKDELLAAFQKANLAIPMRRLGDFFAEVDMNNDGYISFDEWRDFLLFMPNHADSTSLNTIFSYFSHIVTLTAEGDSVVSDETLQGLGTSGSSLTQALFGSILKIASPSSPSGQPESPVQSNFEVEKSSASSLRLSEQERVPQQYPSTSCSSLEESTPMGPQQKAEVIGRDVSRASQSIESVSTNKKTEPEEAHQDSTVKKDSEKSLLIQFIPHPGYFIAGAIAGGISRTATAPLDRLKVYLLVNTKSSSNTALDAAKQGQPVKAVRRAGGPLFTAVRDLYKSGGIRGFFAGNGLNVVKIMPETAIRFGAYEATKQALARFEGHGDTSNIHPASKFAAGGVAGMISQFCVYPLDTLKFRLQSEYVEGGARGNALLLQTAKKMWKQGGVSAAYRGVTMGLIGMFPYSAIDMGTFELLKTTYTTYRARSSGKHEEDCGPGTVVTGIMGACSGAFGATVVYPLNVFRTRLQTQGTAMHPATYTGIWDVATKTVKNEGVRGMYKGLAPNLLKVAPALSITWMVYENAKKVLHLH